MAAVKNVQTVCGPLPGNGFQEIRVNYDFAVDGAAATELDLIVADGDFVVHGFYAKVVSTVTSGGSAVLDVGISGGDVDLFLDAVPVAQLTANSLHKMPIVLTAGTPDVFPPNAPVKIASGEKIVMDTTTDSFLSGKIQFVFLISAF